MCTAQRASSFAGQKSNVQHIQDDDPVFGRITKQILNCVQRSQIVCAPAYHCKFKVGTTLAVDCMAIDRPERGLLSNEVVTADPNGTTTLI